MMRLLLRWYTLLACLLAASSALAQPAAVAERYSLFPASADGIGKRYMGREISAVMGWQGAAWLEREEREREERTDLLLLMLEIKSGMAMADVGAGSGYFARRLAARVGPGGAVYAVDVQPEMVRMLEALARQPGLRQIKPVQGSANSVKLAAPSIDLALMVDVYHEFEFPHEMLASIVQALKPGGRVVFVEYRAEDASVPIKQLHKMSEAQVKTEAARHPLTWERTLGGLPWQHVVVFRKR